MIISILYTDQITKYVIPQSDKKMVLFFKLKSVLWNRKLIHPIILVCYLSAWHWGWSNNWLLYHGETGHAHWTTLGLFVKNN